MKLQFGVVQIAAAPTGKLEGKVGRKPHAA